MLVCKIWWVTDAYFVVEPFSAKATFGFRKMKKMRISVSRTAKPLGIFKHRIGALC